MTWENQHSLGFWRERQRTKEEIMSEHEELGGRIGTAEYFLELHICNIPFWPVVCAAPPQKRYVIHPNSLCCCWMLEEAQG
mmetsp:Transcript_150245/g.262531  ORF Transcript_150245/g.262531 Transcript_150245/m.262531 type:complete len:81 (-) Transcript_150245:201-443(-)